MEVAIIGLICGYGLYNASLGRDPRTAENTYAEVMGAGNGLDEDYDKKPTRMIQNDRKKAQRRWAAAQVPQRSGVILPNKQIPEVMPFFKSGKGMNTNTGYKQRKMELFTGNMLDGHSATGTYKHKKESANMFGTTPQGRVTSGGTVGNAPGDTDLQKARSVNSNKHNNVLPTEQLHVGPGIGVGPEVAAAGGFQSFYRQLPTNVGAYKLNTLPGRVNHGASSVQKPEINQVSQVNHNPGALVLPYEERPPLPASGAIVGKTQYPNEPRGFAGRRPFEEDYGGVADAHVDAIQARTIDVTKGRPRTGEGDTIPAINVNNQSSGTGGYVTSANSDSVTLNSQRAMINKFFLPAGPNAGVSAAGEARPMFAPGSTLREDYEGAYLTGPAGATRQLAERLDVVELQPAGREAKRTEMPYTPGAGRMNLMDPTSQGAQALRNKPTYQSLDFTVPNITNQIPLPTDGANDRAGSKTVSENPWGGADSLNIATKQLATNKFTQDAAADPLVYSPALPAQQQRFRPQAWQQGQDPQLLPMWMTQQAQK